MNAGRHHVKRLLDKTLKCSECGNVQVVYRLPSRNKKTGHIKHMYCPYCKVETAHIEQKL